MALLTNPEKFGANGMSQGELANHLLHIEAALLGLSKKLDGDSGVNSTDYLADMQQILTSGAAPVSDKGLTVTSIIAEYDA